MGAKYQFVYLRCRPGRDLQLDTRENLHTTRVGKSSIYYKNVFGGEAGSLHQDLLYALRRPLRRLYGKEKGIITLLHTGSQRVQSIHI